MAAARHSPKIDAWLRLSRAPGIGPILLGRLLERFQTPEAVLNASRSAWLEVEGLGPRTADRLSGWIDRYDPQPELNRADDLGVTFLALDDDRYPRPLRRIHDPPPVLAVRGSLERRDQFAVAIVGARRCSLYGQEQASRLAYTLALAGVTVVSGLARGIDTAAHQGALAAEGRTLAVLGCGLARLFPPENRALQQRLCRSGACLSELPLDADPLPEHFPRRNRIIAGLTQATVVVEAGQRSGSLITARLALEYDREVLAVPGPIDSDLSRGPHALLRQGAALVESAQDIIDALGRLAEPLQNHVADPGEPRQGQAAPASTVKARLSDTERRIYEHLDKTPRPLDPLIEQTGLPAAVVTAQLIGLQLKGLVRSLPGNRFARR